MALGLPWLHSESYFYMDLYLLLLYMQRNLLSYNLTLFGTKLKAALFYLLLNLD